MAFDPVTAQQAARQAQTYVDLSMATENARAVAAENTKLAKAANLSDLVNVGVARTNLGLGTAATANKVSAGSTGVLDATDASTTNARTPLTHASTHASGGSDPVTVAQTQVTGLSTTLAAKADLVSGLIPTSQMPALSINEIFPVTSQAAMLALTAQRGDVARRTDLTPNQIFMLSADAPSVLANWVLISGDPTAAVDTVNGHTGTVVLGYADVGAVSTTDTRLSNARTPLAHAATHAPGGTDDLTTGLSATALPVALGTAALGSGAGFARSGHVHPTTGLVLVGDSRLSDARTPLPHASSHGLGQSDEIAIDQGQVNGLVGAISSLNSTVSAINTSIATKAPLLETINLVGSSGSGTVTIPDPVATLKTYNKIFLTGNCTIALPTITQAGVISITLLLIQDGTGGRTPTLPGTITWVGGTAPTISSGANTVTEIVLWTEGSSGGWFGVGQAASSGGGGGVTYTVTTKTGSGSVAAGQITLLDTSGGTFQVTVPAAASAVGDVILKWVAGTAAPTVVLSGSDHYNTATGALVPIFYQINESYRLASDGSSIWISVSTDFPGSKIVQTPASTVPSGYVPIGNGSGGYAWGAQSGGGGGASAGSLLAVKEYIDNSNDTLTYANSTPTNIADAMVTAAWSGAAANSLDCGFTAPPSGQVIVELTMNVKSSSNVIPIKVSWYDVDSSTALGFTLPGGYGTVGNRFTYKRLITGLTGGTHYTLRPQWSTTGTATLSGGTNGTIWHSVVQA